MLALAPAAEARFAPPEGRVIHQTLIEERQDPHGTQRYANQRDIVFERAGEGWRARVTIGAGDAPSADAAAMFASGIAGLRGQPIVFNLDAAGMIVSIDDEAALWSRFCDALMAMAGKGVEPDSPRGRDIARLVEPLRAYPSAARRRALGSILSAVIAGPLADRAPGTRAVTVPARGLDGGEHALPGTETVQPGPDELVIDTSAAGDTAPYTSRTVHVSILTHQRIDTARGLIAEQRSHEEIRLGVMDASQAIKITVSSVISY